VRKVLRVSREYKVKKVLKANKEYKAKMGRRAKQAMMVTTAKLVHKVL
jgi:hypothetical protein